MEIITLDFILNQFREWVENKQPISPGLWLDGASKIIALQQNIDEEIAQKKFELDILMADLITKGDSVAKAKMLVAADPKSREYNILVAKQRRIIEFIRLAKKRAEIKYNDF